MNRALLICAAAALALATGPAAADTRQVGLTSFERIAVYGDMIVEVTPDYRFGAVVEASRDAIETLDMHVEERTLIVRQGNAGPYGQRNRPVGPVIIRLRAQNLEQVRLNGGGTIRAGRLRGNDVRVELDGPGEVTADIPDAPSARLRVAGAGSVTVTGRVRTADAFVTGPGTIVAEGLSVRDLVVRANGTGDSRFAALTTAQVTVSGTASVSVAGRPRCTVSNLGSGTVSCGASARDRLPGN